jgi:alkylation response protein AidB-like acyl-CoA dehydrogenase
MRLWLDPEVEDFRAELNTFLDEHAPSEMLQGFDYMDTGAEDREQLIPEWSRAWQATLFDHRWMIPAYPPDLGGRDATPIQTLVYLEEMARRRTLRSLHFPGYAIVAPSLLEFGNADQQALVRPAIRGDTVWCIGMSEPNAGSDLAGLQTRAVLDGDRFIVNGQKVWTSYAMVAQKCFVYVRTNPDVPKHKGISLLIVDMDTPGVDVRPLRHISGAANFAEVFFTDVEVPAANLVGALNDGWRITQGSLAHERAGLWVEGVSRLESTVRSLADMVRRRGLAGDAGIRRRIAEI